jgi:hypothetical protein
MLQVAGGKLRAVLLIVRATGTRALRLALLCGLCESTVLDQVVLNELNYSLAGFDQQYSTRTRHAYRVLS